MNCVNTSCGKRIGIPESAFAPGDVVVCGACGSTWNYEPPGKMTSAEALARVKKAASEGKVEAAPQDAVEALNEWIDRVLLAIGHPDAWVTDESSVGDFTPIYLFDSDDDDDAEKARNVVSRKEWLDAIADRLGLPLERRDLLVDVARRLRDKRRGGVS